MAEEDLCIDTPIEPQALFPTRSLIDMDIASPRNRARSSTSIQTQTQTFKNFTMLKVLNKGKFPVFLVSCEGRVQYYAMKAFPLIKSRLEKCFQNETRFALLSHPNVIKTVYSEARTNVKYKDLSIPASIILTEYAPYGDFYDLIDAHRHNLSEKLVRTYFRQLIEGLEYLHRKGVAHLDLKPENLLLGNNFQLKIADFDLSCFLSDKTFLTKGTEFYRAPEMIEVKCRDGVAADIYSAGILLFVLRCEGKVPHTEHTPFRGIDLFGLLNHDNPEFWRNHCEIQGKKPSDFSHSFKELINNMLAVNPEERWTISQVKSSRWYNGPVYTNEELQKHMKKLFSSS